MSLTKCEKCGGEMDVFDRPPCCLHQPPCAISFGWCCATVWFRGPCARETLVENPPRSFFVVGPTEAPT